MNEALSEMIRSIVSVMEGKVYGIWLYGSTVMDDFRPGWSDIDFVALTDSEISDKQAEELLMLRRKLQERHPDNPCYRAMEGIIANREEYCRQSYRRLVYWGTSGQRITDSFSHDAFSRLELARYGRAVYGGKPWVLPEPDTQELIHAVRSHYETIRKYAVKTDERLYSCGWLLDIARCIYTLRFQDVIAKTQAGKWALAEHIFPMEEPLRKAIQIREEPLRHKDDPQVRKWLSGLGETVQKYADVLERELDAAESSYRGSGGRNMR